ncbi:MULTISPECIES: fimbrial protein [Aeromonas]|uniref:fimbrial protein n=1 Tax=Aeromonas TaxID=642 RepID=UPI00051ADD57|nr:MULTISPECIES: fimbrial protein [Aeromonas]MCH7370850.1 fimbrial protein [Aeromonas sp. MR16]
MTEQTGHYWPGRPILWVLGVLLLSYLLWQPGAHAVNGQCTSPFVATGPITATSTLYQPGATSGPTAFSTTSSATCDCVGISVGLLVTVYYQGSTSLPTVADPSGTLIKLNSYFGLKAEFNAAGSYQTVPFNATSSGLLSLCIGNVVNLALGGINVTGGRYTLKLLKGVTGTQTFNGTVAYLFVRRSNLPDTSPANAFSTLAMNISVTSTPTCQFPAGTSIPIDLGAVAQSAFVEGEVPRGYAPRSVNVSVTCSQIPSDYVVPLSYSFGGALSSQNRFITTSLAGVGVGMLEQDTQTAIPFDTAIAVPYLAATNNTNYKVRLYPTRLPGQVVRTGAYTGTIMVTVSVP